MPTFATTVVFLLLTGCASWPLHLDMASTDNALHDRRPIVVPSKDYQCPHAPPSIALPPNPRTLDNLVQWANATEERRAATADMLEDCGRKVKKLLDTLENE